METDLMPGALASSDIEQFERDGYVIVRQAFARDLAIEIERRWWSELQTAHQISRDDRASWRPIMGDLKAAKRDPIQAGMLTSRVQSVLDHLLGDDAWSAPRDWGRCLATFPEPGPWDVPTGLWHWDSPCELHLEGPSSLFVVSFIGQVAPRSGGTLLLSGSPRLLMQLQRRMSGARRAIPALHWDDFHRVDPWLTALTGKTTSPPDRIAAFMEKETMVDGVPLRVVELTGEPGDMVVCHPAMVHCAAPNRGTSPRFMRIKQQLFTHRGRRLRGQVQPALT